MTIREAMRQGSTVLKTNGIENPRLKTRLLMEYILKQDRQYLMVYDQQPLTKVQEQSYFKAIDQLLQGVPLQHITHQQEFMKMNFYINENVLIPRPDTEILVEEVLEIARKIKAKKILDLCTGSGAIAISLAKYIENSEIIATDISEEALKVAEYNAKRNQVDKQIAFLKSDLWKDIPKEKYDMIVSNPPYIRKQVLQTLDREVLQEPLIALEGGEDGLDFYRKIVQQAYEFLKYKGYLCLEIGYDQKKEVMEFIEKEDKYADTYSKQDLYGNDRIVITRVGD